MRRLKCECGAELFFEGTRCLSCGYEVAFSLKHLKMLRLQDGTFPDEMGGQSRKCQNHERGICNWLVQSDDPNALCRSCRLSRVIPDLSITANVVLLGEFERAKRRLVYQLALLGLRLESKTENPAAGLCFDVKAQVPGEDPVLIGHEDGVITLKLEEANVVYREQTRTQLEERYRTLVGHCRHESGHYFYDRLIADHNRFEDFRRLFGDERVDYRTALAAYYATTPSNAWRDSHITQYASSHPWEDWAETWAHYLHMTATLETAHGHQLIRSTTSQSAIERVLRLESVPAPVFDAFILAWTSLSVVLNELNRSLGLDDAYPFELNPRVVEKLHFIHQLVVAQSEPIQIAFTQEPPLQLLAGGRG
jgi:hypothetical protein